MHYWNGKELGFVFHIRKIPTPLNCLADEIKKIWKQIPATERVFAQIIAVSPKIVDVWESGKHCLKGPARRLTHAIAQIPKEASKFI